MKQSHFTQEQLRTIADSLGDTDEGLTGSEIAHLLASARMADTDPALTKRHRLYNAFANDQNKRQNRTHIIFIRKAMKPANFVREPDRFEPMRANVNRALAFAGLSVTDSGELKSAERCAQRIRGSRDHGITNGKYRRKRKHGAPQGPRQGRGQSPRALSVEAWPIPYRGRVPAALEKPNVKAGLGVRFA